MYRGQSEPQPLLINADDDDADVALWKYCNPVVTNGYALPWIWGYQEDGRLPEDLPEPEEPSESELLDESSDDDDDADEPPEELLDESSDALPAEPSEELLEEEEEEDELLSESESESESELVSRLLFFSFFWDFCASRALSSASAAFLAAASLTSGG